jgi:antitoxin component YwqK of YwqJK toxin-antitoxin module
MKRNGNTGSGQGKWVAIIFLLVLTGLVTFFLRRSNSSTRSSEGASIPLELSRTNLALEAGHWKQPGSTTFFNGVMVEHYPNGVLRSRSVVSNGLVHGLSEGWYTNAQLQVAEFFKEGVSDGLRTKWYPSGAKQSEAQVAGGRLNGRFQKWHENGVLSEQVNFVDGQPKGPSLAYFPSGNLKARVTMKDNKPTAQEFWNDGEKKE